MAKPSDRSPERKLQVVLSVLPGELTAAEAARRGGVSEQTVHNWKRAFLEAGREGLVQGQRRRSSRELELEPRTRSSRPRWARPMCSCGSRS